MKFDCGETPKEELKRKEEWHDFFTIWPRQVESHDCRFLETIERKGIFKYAGYSYGCWEWEYRAKNDS